MIQLWHHKIAAEAQLGKHPTSEHLCETYFRYSKHIISLFWRGSKTKTKTLGGFYSTTPRLLRGTHSRPTCVIPDSRSTPSSLNWNLINFRLSCVFLFFYSTLFACLFCRACWNLNLSEKQTLKTVMSLNFNHTCLVSPPDRSTIVSGLSFWCTTLSGPFYQCITLSGFPDWWTTLSGPSNRWTILSGLSDRWTNLSLYLLKWCYETQGLGKARICVSWLDSLSFDFNHSIMSTTAEYYFRRLSKRFAIVT